MLQSMAYGGYLGDSLFSNVRLTSQCDVFPESDRATRSYLRLHIYRSSLALPTLSPRNHTMRLLPL